MPQFNYTIVNSDGHLLKGLLTSPTREDALVELHKNGSRPPSSEGSQSQEKKDVASKTRSR
jgi:type II secretory pathway component PulF